MTTHITRVLINANEPNSFLPVHTITSEKKVEKAEKRNFVLKDVKLPTSEIINCNRKLELLFNWVIKILMFPRLIITVFT